MAECPRQPNIIPGKQKRPIRGPLSQKNLGGIARKASMGVAVAETPSNPESPRSKVSSSSEGAEQQLSGNGYKGP